MDTSFWFDTINLEWFFVYVIVYFALSYIPYNVQYLYPILTSIRYGSCELPNLGT